MKIWRSTSLLLAGVFFCLPVSAAAPEAAAPSLHAVVRPCSLAKVCQELSRRFNARVTVDPALAEQRVAWAFISGASLKILLARLAELTDCRLIERPPREGAAGTSKLPRYLLERKPQTARLEAAWRRAGLLHTIQE